MVETEDCSVTGVIQGLWVGVALNEILVFQVNEILFVFGTETRPSVFSTVREELINWQFERSSSIHTRFFRVQWHGTMRFCAFSILEHSFFR